MHDSTLLHMGSTHDHVSEGVLLCMQGQTCCGLCAASGCKLRLLSGTAENKARAHISSIDTSSLWGLERCQFMHVMRQQAQKRQSCGSYSGSCQVIPIWSSWIFQGQHPERCQCMQIVQQLLGEVEAASAAMLAGLLARLKGSIQLPECLRVVGCLRRLAAFPEPELRRRCAASLMYALSSALPW